MVGSAPPPIAYGSAGNGRGGGHGLDRDTIDRAVALGGDRRSVAAALGSGGLMTASATIDCGEQAGARLDRAVPRHGHPTGAGHRRAPVSTPIGAWRDALDPGARRQRQLHRHPGRRRGADDERRSDRARSRRRSSRCSPQTSPRPLATTLNYAAGAGPPVERRRPCGSPRTAGSRSSTSTARCTSPPTSSATPSTTPTTTATTPRRRSTHCSQRRPTAR